jgi:hypothetical protein
MGIHPRPRKYRGGPQSDASAEGRSMRHVILVLVVLLGRQEAAVGQSGPLRGFDD